MWSVESLLVITVVMPLVAAVLTALLGPRLLGRQSHWPTIIALAISFPASLGLVWQVSQEVRSAPLPHEACHASSTSGQGSKGLARFGQIGQNSSAGLIGSDASGRKNRLGYERVIRLWTWSGGLLPGGDISSRQQAPDSLGPPPHIEVSLRVDPLTAIMLATVTVVSLLVAIYSVGYMHGDPGYWRFYSYIALFVFSMCMLVSVSNFLLLYVFWEAVGLCSYLLIGFWYQRPAAAAAGKKAFLVNRVGDFGFALGVFLLWMTYGTLNFHDVQTNGHTQPGILGQIFLQHPEHYVGGVLGTAIALLLMAGACGKSAQWPLHVWLPDAMEGPTPVSALIHAATMVTAGVYLTARCLPLFLAAPIPLVVVACIGGGTALLGALIALTQTDLKRILAYSTISQLGYMFLAVGTGTVLGVTAGMFHLFTHAFFKALLFLAAGSIMHAMGGLIDLQAFGGLRRYLPWTHTTMLFGCLALAGIVPFAGFWSKDAILVAVGQQEGWVYQLLGWTATLSAFLTAFYIFRAFFLCFYGPERIPVEAEGHLHEGPAWMTVPLVLLAAASLVLGAYFEWTHGFAHFLAQTPSLCLAGLAQEGPRAAWSSHSAVAVVSTLVALAGIALAALLYLGPRTFLETLTQASSAVGIYWLSYRKFFFDELYQLVIVRPLSSLAHLCGWLDNQAIDGAVHGIGATPQTLGGLFRGLQMGFVPFYALAMILGLLVLLGALMTG
ncbi:MAG: NADH-quinone oxidoreductase subunit L [Thermoguttaceae bacterium]|nr:NADH-quinone oxidoreductase subunit L [Thermoguttaceae bacterium]MDW8037458.1 NADH-quinone oxidoreductase subunit L [Thermoguttaceae bacterium]